MLHSQWLLICSSLLPAFLLPFRPASGLFSLLGGLVLLHLLDFLVETTVLHGQVVNFVIQFSDVVVLLSDDGG